MIVGIVLSGAFIGNNNTLITEAVMGAAPVERPVASAAYSFVRFCGGRDRPLRRAEAVRPAAGRPRARAVLVRRGDGRGRLVILAAGSRLLTRALARPPRVAAPEEAEAVLVGDLD